MPMPPTPFLGGFRCPRHKPHAKFSKPSPAASANRSLLSTASSSSPWNGFSPGSTASSLAACPPSTSLALPSEFDRVAANRLPRRVVSVSGARNAGDKPEGEAPLHSVPKVLNRNVLRAWRNSGRPLNDAEPFSWPTARLELSRARQIMLASCGRNSLPGYLQDGRREIMQESHLRW